MKRLIKTTTLNKILKLAENLLNDDQLNQINRAINQLTVNNRPKPLVNVYNEILNKAECTYSNTVYRKITFDLNDIVALNNSYKISKDEVFNYIKNNLKTNSYQSCTKSLETCRNFEADWFDFEVIISFECSEGIDVMAICNKYLEIARQRYKDVQSGNSESKYGRSYYLRVATYDKDSASNMMHKAVFQINVNNSGQHSLKLLEDTVWFNNK